MFSMQSIARLCIGVITLVLWALVFPTTAWAVDPGDTLIALFGGIIAAMFASLCAFAVCVVVVSALAYYETREHRRSGSDSS